MSLTRGGFGTIRQHPPSAAETTIAFAVSSTKTEIAMGRQSGRHLTVDKNQILVL